MIARNIVPLPRGVPSMLGVSENPFTGIASIWDFPHRGFPSPSALSVPKRPGDFSFSVVREAKDWDPLAVWTMKW